jgi:hypothetical protein
MIIFESGACHFYVSIIIIVSFAKSRPLLAVPVTSLIRDIRRAGSFEDYDRLSSNGGAIFITTAATFQGQTAPKTSNAGRKSPRRAIWQHQSGMTKMWRIFSCIRGGWILSQVPSLLTAEKSQPRGHVKQKKMTVSQLHCQTQR